MIRLILGEESSTNVPNKVDFSDREYITKVAEELVSVCKARDALSLSAPQINHNIQMFVIKDWTEYKIFINPKVVYESPELAQGSEACLSFPGLSVKINRSYSIRVRYQTINGDTKTENFDSAPARLFQHEMTHMQGKIFWDDANFLNRNKAIKDWKSIKRKLSKLSGALPPVQTTN